MLDPHKLTDLKQLAIDKRREVIHYFLMDTEASIEKLRGALRLSSLDELQKIAHVLTVSCSQIGASALGHIANNIEISSAKQIGQTMYDLSELTTQIQELMINLNATRTEFLKLIESI